MNALACAAFSFVLFACASGTADGRVALGSAPVSFELDVPQEGRPILRLEDVRVAEGEAAVIHVKVNGEKAMELNLVPSRSQASAEGAMSAGQNFNVPLKGVRAGGKVTVTLEPQGEANVTMKKPYVTGAQ